MTTQSSPRPITACPITLASTRHEAKLCHLLAQHRTISINQSSNQSHSSINNQTHHLSKLSTNLTKRWWICNQPTWAALLVALHLCAHKHHHPCNFGAPGVTKKGRWPKEPATRLALHGASSVGQSCSSDPTFSKRSLRRVRHVQLPTSCAWVVPQKCQRHVR
jgi:hypothetical protein